MLAACVSVTLFKGQIVLGPAIFKGPTLNYFWSTAVLLRGRAKGLAVLN